MTTKTTIVEHNGSVIQSETVFLIGGKEYDKDDIMRLWRQIDAISEETLPRKDTIVAFLRELHATLVQTEPRTINDEE